MIVFGRRQLASTCLLICMKLEFSCGEPCYPASAFICGWAVRANVRFRVVSPAVANKIKQAIGVEGPSLHIYLLISIACKYTVHNGTECVPILFAAQFW